MFMFPFEDVTGQITAMIIVLYLPHISRITDIHYLLELQGTATTVKVNSSE